MTRFSPDNFGMLKFYMAWLIVRYSLFDLERRLSPLMAPLESQQGSDADFEEGCSTNRETKYLDRVEQK